MMRYAQQFKEKI